MVLWQPKKKKRTINFICHHLFMFLSLSDPTVSVPIYLLLLNLLFIFPLRCPHALHCLTWSSSHSTIKSCYHQGDFSTLGTAAGSRLCLAPRSFPSWPHYYCEKPMQKSVWLLGRLHLWYQHLQLNYWADIFLLLLFNGWYFVLDKLFWDKCTRITLYMQYYFHVFLFISYREVYCLLVFILWSLFTSYLSEMEFTCMGSSFCVMNITKNLRQTCQCFVTQN